MTSTSCCPICHRPLDPGYRSTAFDRPARINVLTHGGRCQDTVRGWTAEQLTEHIARQRAGAGYTAR